MTLVSTAFLTIDHLANLYGEPFAAHPTSVPIDRICERLVDDCGEVRDKLVMPMDAVGVTGSSEHVEPALR